MEEAVILLQLLNELALPVGAGAVIVFGWQISSRIGKLEGRMEATNEKISKLDADIQAEMRDMRTEMHGMRAEMSDVKERLIRMESRKE